MPVIAFLPANPAPTILVIDSISDVRLVHELARSSEVVLQPDEQGSGRRDRVPDVHVEPGRQRSYAQRLVAVDEYLVDSGRNRVCQLSQAEAALLRLRAAEPRALRGSTR